MNPVDILLIEDNEGDILLTREAFEHSRIVNNMNIVRDGKAAVEYLAKMGSYADAAMPDLILLDINLPKKNGHSVLNFIKSESSLKHIPVIVLTTSSAQADIDMSYENHANCFITKPVDGDTFLDVISKIEAFWVTVVRLPAKTNAS